MANASDVEPSGCRCLMQRVVRSDHDIAIGACKGSLVVAVSDVCGMAALVCVVFRPCSAADGFDMTPEAERHCETEYTNDRQIHAIPKNHISKHWI